MRKTLFTYLVGALASTIIARADPQFVPPEPGSLELGTTTRAMIEGRYGDDYAVGTVTKNGQTVETISYTEVSVRKSKAIVAKVTPARALSFYFVDAVLVGYEYASSFADDHTMFDESKVSEVKEGETSVETAKELFGPRFGEYRYPVIDSQDEHAIVYIYSQVKGSGFSPKIYVANLVLRYDAEGTVTKVEFTSQGEK